MRRASPQGAAVEGPAFSVLGGEGRARCRASPTCAEGHWALCGAWGTLLRAAQALPGGGCEAPRYQGEGRLPPAHQPLLGHSFHGR